MNKIGECILILFRSALSMLDKTKYENLPNSIYSRKMYNPIFSVNWTHDKGSMVRLRTTKHIPNCTSMHVSDFDQKYYICFWTALFFAKYVHSITTNNFHFLTNSC